jgi:hypothetical protein
MSIFAPPVDIGKNESIMKVKPAGHAVNYNA